MPQPSNHPFGVETADAPSDLARRLAGPSQDLVVVDVQPSLEPLHGREYAQSVVQLMGQAPRVLVVFTEDERIHDTWAEVDRYFAELGLIGRQITYVGKPRDWFSPWFDGARFPDIVEVAREMLEAGVEDSRELAEVDDLGRGIQLPPSTLMNLLATFDGANLVGGSRGECLDEIELTAEMLGVRLVTLEDFVWVRE